MLRFRLGRIPVEVLPSHWFIAGLIAWSFLPATSTSGPSLSSLVKPESLGLLAMGIVVVFVSILVHELGHALVALAFGYRPTIQLAWLGGATQPNARGPIPWKRDLLLTFAGPALESVLAVAARFALPLAAHTPYLWYGLEICWYVNICWAVLNLVPVLPLDGGRIAHVLFLRLFGKKGVLAAQGLGAAVSLGIAYWALERDMMWVGLFFAFFGAQAIRVLLAARRAEAKPDDPDQRRLAEALREFQTGQLDVAKRQAELLLSKEPAAHPQIQAKSHRLLGWIAIKDGQGRAALDHFSQVRGEGVEPAALAAAFSLVGDDVRALPLWELAAQGGDRTVLHEWAGALVRLGREREAKEIPEIDMAAAFACAERVCFVRERFSEAADFALRRLSLRPTAEAAYDAACALARAGDARRAIDLLDRASELGFTDSDHAARDPDLASLHGHPGFERWCQTPYAAT